jgi:CHASE3 domain sensor protein
MAAVSLPDDAQALISVRVAGIEASLTLMDEAFASGEPQQVDAASAALQRSLAEALEAFQQMGNRQQDALTPALRTRLQHAQAHAQAQQLAVHRASGYVQRTLGVLFPGDIAPATYGVLGHNPTARALAAYR